VHGQNGAVLMITPNSLAGTVTDSLTARLTVLSMPGIGISCV